MTLGHTNASTDHLNHHGVQYEPVLAFGHLCDRLDRIPINGLVLVEYKGACLHIGLRCANSIVKNAQVFNIAFDALLLSFDCIVRTSKHQRQKHDFTIGVVSKRT